ncbi:MAG: cytochrome c oxidase accessory protein CcoG [Chitinophagaceae bacterium]|nr:cytochrome c oxidase accessory protein CcoG [Chitinophagaceae bacterium]
MSSPADRQLQPDFKDKISTVDTKGKRKWMYVFQPQGRLYNLRTIFSIVYLIILFTLPFIQYHGNPIFLFDVTKSKFIFFGQVFLPQDFILFGIGMLVFLLFIVVFTLIFGRVFCGWACPQTIFLEMIFRRIEYWIEGPAHKQQAANAKSWTTEMYIRKGIKHVVYLAIAFLIANTFLSYIIGLKELTKIIQEPISSHTIGFLLILLFTFLFYAVFAHVREIVCTVACPYGRLQSVLLDKNSIAVSYDHKRGEPRSKKRKDDGSVGDCIDCGMCVNVCPTGIDIRNGQQLECVNCTACIDACNMMMRKIGQPEELIRYASENDIEKGEKPRFTYRIKMYSVVLVILLGLLVALLVTRSRFDATVLRVPGQILQENADGTISNLYKIRVVNKSGYTEPYTIRIKEDYARIEYVGKSLDSLPSAVEKEETFFIKVPKTSIDQRKKAIHIDVMSGNEIIQTKKISFIGEY